MKEKRISSALKNQFVSNTALIFCFTFWVVIFSSHTLLAEINHQKNFLVGDRAALMGGAYSAVSDDAAGAFYNPAGIAFAYGDSVSGSGNAFHQVKTKYKKVLGNQYDWDRESKSLLPNYFGLIKKYGDYPSHYLISFPKQ